MIYEHHWILILRIDLKIIRIKLKINILIGGHVFSLGSCLSNAVIVFFIYCMGVCYSIAVCYRLQ